RDGGLEAEARGPCELRRRLLAKAPEEARRALEVGPRGRVGDGEQAQHEADRDGVDTRLEERDPGGRAEDGVDGATPDAGAHGADGGGDEAGGGEEGADREPVRVRGRDDGEGDDVVDDDGGEQERAQTVREARPDEG